MDVHAGSTVGPYRLLEEIGRGGMSRVFAAAHERMARTVALKLLSPEKRTNPEIAARFLREARALAQLDHPHIVRILHSDRLTQQDTDDAVYLAMEMLEGVSLRAWLAQHPGPCELSFVRDIVAQIAAAMVAVHDAEIVHRDLKPDNIFLLTDPQRPSGYHVKVLDFGIAKIAPDSASNSLDTRLETQRPSFMGTAAYMSPEQCRDVAAVDAATDVYALGVMLFELLTGELPFAAQESIDVITMHVREPAPSAHQRRPEIPLSLDILVASMLAKQASERPSMTQVLARCSQSWRDSVAYGSECPLPGLQAFGRDHSELFCGRAKLVEQLLAALTATDASPPALLIEGPAGSGKSSLVHAGLLPKLVPQPTSTNQPSWYIAHLTTDERPSNAIARALVASADADPQTSQAIGRLADQLAADWPASIFEQLPEAHQLLCIIDPLERLATPHPSPHTDSQQLDQLLDMLSETDAHQDRGPIRLLMISRPNFMTTTHKLSCWTKLLRDATHFTLPAPDQDTLQTIVTEITRRTGMQLTEGLPQRIVREARNTTTPLPLLGHLLRTIWMTRTARGEPQVTHEHYDALGGVSGALARRAERLLDREALGSDGRERARWLILALVWTSRGLADTLRPRRRDEAVRAAGGDERADQLLRQLAGEHAPGDEERDVQLLSITPLLSDLPRATSTETSASSPHYVTLVHEALLTQVPSIATWLMEARPQLERHTELETTAQAWQRSGSQRAGLPSGTLLDHYCGHAKDPQQRALFERIASATARRFVAQARQQQSLRRVAWATALSLLVAITVVAVATSLWAQRERARAEQNLNQIILGNKQVVSDLDWVLSRFHHTVAIRRDLLTQLDENLIALPADEQSRPRVRRSMITTKHRRGDLELHDGTLATAASFYDAAHDLITEGQSAANTTAGLDQALLAMNHSKRGKVAVARGQYPVAEQHFDAALALMRPNLDRDDPNSRRTLAVSAIERADLWLARQRPERATPLYDEALALQRQNRASEYDRALLALFQVKRAHAARSRDAVIDTEALLAEALENAASVVKDNPGNAFFRWILGRVHVELSALHLRRGVLDDASVHCDRARTLGRALHAGDPTNKRYALMYSDSLAECGALLTERGALDEARAVRAERCEIMRTFQARDGEDLRFRAPRCS
ncbi:MAG: hypothetical protein Tsb0020_03770 [Haliangiales bacterium]